MDRQKFLKEARENSTYGLTKAKALREKREAGSTDKTVPFTDAELEKMQKKQAEMRAKLKEAGMEFGPSFPMWGRILF